MDFDFDKIIADLQNGKITQTEATKKFEKYASEQANKTYLNGLRKEFGGKAPTVEHLSRGLLLYWMDKYGQTFSPEKFSQMEKLMVDLLEDKFSWFCL